MPPDAEVYGMEVNKLQSGITVDSDNVLHGVLHYVDGYEGYATGASGNFVALRLTAPSGATVKYTSEAVKDGVLKSDDRLMVWKVSSKESTLTITVEQGDQHASTTYKATGLTLEPKE